MSLTIESRLWLATHLLYPNSSQAFDVYQSLVSQYDDSLKKNKTAFVFFKLSQIVDKIPAVNSNKSFHVFENQNIDKWQTIYKNSQKEQLVIFIGYFIFELTLQNISESLQISYEKTYFSFQQAFKKTVFTNAKLDISDKIALKKFNQEKVSFLFTKESLIDYCLKNLSQKEMNQVKAGLETYPELQFSEKQYSKIVEQMRSLVENQKEKVTKPLIQTSDTLSTQRNSIQFKNIFIEHKTLFTSVALSVLCLVIVMIRPQWIQQISQTSRDHFVVLQEIQPKPNLAENSLDDRKKINLNELPLEARSQIEIQKQITVSGRENQIAIASATVKTGAKAPDSVAANSISKKTGGLYRGVLLVTDINEVTPKITQKIVDIGAKKAGDVELGWRKSEKLSYYHFTLPENNIEAAKEFLSQFGSLQIQFENHPRLMPAGVKRLIIEVKEHE